MKQILVIALAILYALWPYDLLADLIPGWGWIDDLAVLYLAWQIYRRLGKPSRKSTAAGGGDSTGTDEDSRHGEMDPSTVLGVAQDAGPEEISRAYRRLAAQYHPDKVQHLGEEFRDLAERRFKEIQAAYDELKKRGRV